MNERTFGRDRAAGTERGFRGSVDKGTSEFQSRNPRLRQNERHSDRTVEPSRNKRESKGNTHYPGNFLLLSHDVLTNIMSVQIIAIIIL